MIFTLWGASWNSPKSEHHEVAPQVLLVCLGTGGAARAQWVTPPQEQSVSVYGGHRQQTQLGSVDPCKANMREKDKKMVEEEG